MSIPRFNVEKIKMLRHSNKLRMKRLRAALNSLSPNHLGKYNMMVLAKEASVIMEIMVMGDGDDGDPCSLDIQKIFNVIIQDMPISPKLISHPGTHTLQLVFKFPALDLYGYDKDFVNVLTSLGFIEEDDEKVELIMSAENDEEEFLRKNLRVFDLEYCTATKKFWSILKRLFGEEANPFEGDFYDGEGIVGSREICSYRMYYHYTVGEKVFDRKTLDV